MGGHGIGYAPGNEEDFLDYAEHGTVQSGYPGQPISGTGLTSQSFGTRDSYDHHSHPPHDLHEGHEGCDIGGPELHRLPSYEVESSHQTINRGLRKASYNLERKSSKDKAEGPDDEDFTSGLFKTRDPNVQTSVSGDEKHKNYQIKQTDKENVGGTYLI